MRIEFSEVETGYSQRAQGIGGEVNWSSGKADFLMLQCANLAEGGVLMG